MRKLGLLTAATIAAATLTATTTHATTTTQQIQSLRSGIQWERARAWHWQQVAGIRRSPTIRGAALPHSVGYLKWIEHRWSKRRVYAYKIAHRPTYRAIGGIAHWALWNCIHNGAYPGAPHEGNGWDPSGTYSGPLQMTSGWAGYPISDWNTVPLAEVYADAEAQYRANHYSSRWLKGQWPRTSPPCLGYR